MGSGELLAQAADALENGVDPFSGEWLREHDVTLGDCIDLANDMAAAIRYYIGARERIISKVMRLAEQKGGVDGQQR